MRFFQKRRTVFLLLAAAVGIAGLWEGFRALGKATVTTGAGANNWGLSFPVPGQSPVGNATPEELRRVNTYFLGDTSQKVVYLTFDCGYENGNTAPILDALQKHGAKATFFVVGHFIESAPDCVRRMVAEGHLVGNHTYHHPDLSEITDETAFAEELSAVEDAFTALTGTSMTKFYRPPRGKYSLANLETAKKLGYTGVFWSLAYVDWMTDRQPTKEQAFDKLLTRIHPGAVVLLHNTSATNGAILDELLTKWEEMGYTFGQLTDFIRE